LVAGGSHHPIQNETGRLRVSRLAPQHQETQWPDFELFLIWVFDLGGGSDFSAQCAFDHRFESGFASRGESLRLNEQIIGEIERSFQMG
jgi:hypothetical protein